MPKVLQQTSGEWSVVSDCGEVIASGLSNSRAWRIADQAAGEALSASEVAQDMKEPPVKPSQDAMQDFYSGLVWISRTKGYKPGWAWHKFLEKFGRRPDGLHDIPAKPGKDVWGWVNRASIPKRKGA